MNTTTNIDLPQEQIRLLQVFKAIGEKKPISIQMEDLPKIQELSKELQAAEKQDELTLKRISQLEGLIEQKQIEIESLRSRLNKNLQYLKHLPEQAQTDKPKVIRTTNGKLEPISEEQVMEALQNGAKGNVELLTALNLPVDKPFQNKIYGVCKSLQESGKLTSENRKWRLP